ncbi:MAG: G1 family glutamic endopeptidase, partial [Phycisphaerae bacterium]
SAFWVGLDGFNSSTVEQTGIEAQISGNTATYYAWYEMYPAAETPISSITVRPGDNISASVNYDTSTGNFTLAIDDLTSRGSYSKSVSGSGEARTSAEWIAEAPTIQNRNGTDSLTTLADFGSVAFSSASVSVANSGGTVTTGSINAISSLASVDSIQMQTSGGKLEAIPSRLGSGGSAFTVTYVPEPASLALLAFGVAAISLLQRRTKKTH